MRLVSKKEISPPDPSILAMIGPILFAATTSDLMIERVYWTAFCEKLSSEKIGTQASASTTKNRPVKNLFISRTPQLNQYGRICYIFP